jgi:hypothetical protein
MLPLLFRAISTCPLQTKDPNLVMIGRQQICYRCAAGVLPVVLLCHTLAVQSGRSLTLIQVVNKLKFLSHGMWGSYTIVARSDIQYLCSINHRTLEHNKFSIWDIRPLSVHVSTYDQILRSRQKQLLGGSGSRRMTMPAACRRTLISFLPIRIDDSDKLIVLIITNYLILIFK